MTDKELDELLFRKAREIEVPDDIFDWDKFWKRIEQMEKEKKEA